MCEGNVKSLPRTSKLVRGSLLCLAHHLTSPFIPRCRPSSGPRGDTLYLLDGTYVFIPSALSSVATIGRLPVSLERMIGLLHIVRPPPRSYYRQFQKPKLGYYVVPGPLCWVLQCRSTHHESTLLEVCLPIIPSNFTRRSTTVANPGRILTVIHGGEMLPLSGLPNPLTSQYHSSLLLLLPSGQLRRVVAEVFVWRSDGCYSKQISYKRKSCVRPSAMATINREELRALITAVTDEIAPEPTRHRLGVFTRH